MKRHLDGDLVSPDTADLDLGDGGKSREFILDLIRQFLQRTLGHIAINNEPHHAHAVGHLPETGTFGTGRERLYAIDGRLDIVQCPSHVRIEIHLNPHGCHTRGRYGLDRLHVIQSTDLVFDLDDD